MLKSKTSGACFIESDRIDDECENPTTQNNISAANGPKERKFE